MPTPLRLRPGLAALSCLALAVTLLAGCGTVMNQVGKVAGRLMTTTTADLSEAAVQVRFVRNLYPPEAQTTEARFVGDAWQAGRNMAVINFQKRAGAGFYEIDGTVTVDGEPLVHAGNGFYGKIFDADDLSPKTFVVETSAGQRSTFTVGPAEPIRIQAVNGRREGAEIDMRQDFTLELENPAGDAPSEIRVAFLFDLMGNRAWQEVGIFRPQERLTIPAEVFRHYMGTALAQGDTYLLVERFRTAPAEDAAVGAAQLLSTAWDAVPVRLTGGEKAKVPGMGLALNTDLSNGLFIEGTTEVDGRRVAYTATKPNAFLGRPFDTAARLGVVSFTVRATRLTQQRTKTTSSTTYAGAYQYTTTTTTTQTRQFPKLPDAFWERLVEAAYADFERTLRDRWQVEVVPIEAALRSPSYAGLEPIDDHVTAVEVEKGYRGSKNLIPTTLGAIMSNVSTTFASDRIDARLIRELGVDGLVAVTLDLEMQTDFDADAEASTRLVPRMSFRISGPPNGYLMGPTIYATGVMEGEGVPFSDLDPAGTPSEDFLKRMVQQEALIAAFDQALGSLHAAEQQEPAYHRLWALKAAPGGPRAAAQ